MPKRSDIKKIMLIGSGPIVIGQACEFDYSGVQACKSLKEEGYEVVLVNSNPATIMTDPEFADRTYIEPLTVDILQEIIRRERPDAILPTLGGQTALNLAIELHDKGILKRYGVEMIGAKAEVIRKAEDRQLFKKAMQSVGLDLPVSVSCHSLDEAMKAKEFIGKFPLVIRPGFTLGGTGGGIAYNEKEYAEIVTRGLFYSPTSEVLIEESILGWKEFELEVMRDSKDNCVIVCSIENFDPMGIHTGDSITVAPIQTLTDREYQKMRDAAIAVMREVGVDTGGSNVQFAMNPENGRMVIIEMNPRVSRSSALASKATGFPIAKIAAKLAVGYTLDEIRNDITKETPACFEPSIDYVVTKIPRFAFEKFAAADDTLGTQMKSVGEAMSIGRTFKQSFQKALRSLETGRAGFGADGKDQPFERMTDDEIKALLVRPTARRVFVIRAAFKRGWSVEKINKLTGIDLWFLRHLEELVAYEDEIKKTGSIAGIVKNPALFRQAKEFGYSDRQLAYLLKATEDEVRAARETVALLPVYGLVDTCAAEFTAFTPYFYSTYGDVNDSHPDDRKKIMIIGGGPNRIGQGIEFDYCCVHASFALRDAGFETIMVNSNPETVSTDYDTSDRLYFEPLTLEDVLSIYRNEKCWGAIVQFGGQTPLNLAKSLEKNGVNIIGTSPASIEIAEDRKYFKDLVTRLKIRQPESGIAVSIEEAEKIAERIGYPVLMRPSFVLGGRAMVIVYDREMLRKYMVEAVEVSEKKPILIDDYLEHALEVDVDCISDGETSVIGAIMEHVELAGIHSGDSACTIPAPSLSPKIKDIIRKHTYALAKELKVCGLMNIQYAIQKGDVYVLEVNPRASRTVPFVSKAIGVPLAKLAALVMAGFKLKELAFTKEVQPRHWSVKEAVFPFIRFPGIDVILSPEMKSTGEVMGIDSTAGVAFLKSQVAAGNTIPVSGNVFLSVRDEDKKDVVPLAKRLVDLDFSIYATLGTSTVLRDNGIRSQAVFRISKGRPNVVDMIEEKNVAWIVNNPSSGAEPQIDEKKMRAHAVIRGIPITTTIDGLRAAINGLELLRDVKHLEVCSLQEYHRHAPRINLVKRKIKQMA
ncbi:MAG: carbamoyl phosphate synthase large subunit [Lentisphaerae bacterium RIFOXYA12_FULL_48_11]|nr:MAG: carbamoyl phosphate synthase large subunit [Lentisphaerae bacterium RIFOXYA12_FULL_48_11]